MNNKYPIASIVPALEDGAGGKGTLMEAQFGGGCSSNRWNCPFFAVFAFFAPFFTPENRWNEPFPAFFTPFSGLGAYAPARLTATPNL